MGSSRLGLTATEAAARLARFGPNHLPPALRRQWYLELGANFVHLFALLLWMGARLAWIAGMPQLTWAIVTVIVINGLFSFWQEFQAERAAEALQALLPHQVTVRRDGGELRVDVETVVPGDVLILGEGDAIPADARLIRAERLRVDTSSLTGESRPVPRWDEPTDASGRTVSNLPNLVALIHLPTLATAFGLAPLSAPQWLLLAAFALLVLLLEEVRKAVARRVGAWG